MIVILAMHFAPNVDEARARALKRWSRFSRQPGENIKSMYVRFKVERRKVAEEAGLQIPWDVQAEKIIHMCPMPRQELLKLLDNITRIFNGNPQHNMMRSYIQEVQGPSTQIFAALEDGHEGAFHGHLPIRDRDGTIIDWKEQAEQNAADWMASFPVGVSSDTNEFLNALIGHDDLFREPQYDGHQSWPTSGSSYSEQAWYGHETPSSGYSSHSWAPPRASYPYQQALPAPPSSMQSYPIQPQVSHSHYPPNGGFHQYAYMSQPPPFQDDREPSSDGTDSDTSSDDGAPNPSLDKISDYISQTVGSDPNAYEQAIFTAYRHSKRLWRRHKGKAVRKFRRFVKRGVRKRKGSGKGRFYRSYPAIEQSSKGKCKRNTSGKGFGRKGNPVGKGGKMLCHECQSPDHLVKDCPIRKAKLAQGGKGGGFSGALLTDSPHDDQNDFAPWEDVDPDVPGQYVDAEVSFPTGHPSTDSQDASWYFVTLDPDDEDAETDIVGVYEGCDWQDVEMTSGAVHGSGQAAAAPSSAQPEPSTVPTPFQEVQAAGPASSSASPSMPKQPILRRKFRGGSYDRPFCSYEVSRESGHILCLTCQMWLKTADTLEKHVTGSKHEKNCDKRTRLSLSGTDGRTCERDQRPSKVVSGRTGPSDHCCHDYGLCCGQSLSRWENDVLATHWASQ